LGIDFGQADAAIDLRLATAKQVEVGTVQDQQLGHPTTPGEGGAVCLKWWMVSS